jgi:hypothetical protein
MRAKGREAHKPERIEDKGVRRMEKQAWEKAEVFHMKMQSKFGGGLAISPHPPVLPGYQVTSDPIAVLLSPIQHYFRSIQRSNYSGIKVTWVTRVTRGGGKIWNPWRRLVLQIHVKRG